MIHTTILDTTNHNYQYFTLINTISPDSGAVFLNQFNQAFIRMATGENDLQIQCYNSPLPVSGNFKNFEDSIDGFFAALIFTMAMVFIVIIKI